MFNGTAMFRRTSEPFLKSKIVRILSLVPRETMHDRLERSQRVLSHPARPASLVFHLWGWHILKFFSFFPYVSPTSSGLRLLLGNLELYSNLSLASSDDMLGVEIVFDFTLETCCAHNWWMLFNWNWVSTTSTRECPPPPPEKDFSHSLAEIATCKQVCDVQVKRVNTLAHLFSLSSLPTPSLWRLIHCALWSCGKAERERGGGGAEEEKEELDTGFYSGLEWDQGQWHDLSLFVGRSFQFPSSDSAMVQWKKSFKLAYRLSCGRGGHRCWGVTCRYSSLGSYVQQLVFCVDQDEPLVTFWRMCTDWPSFFLDSRVGHCKSSNIRSTLKMWWYWCSTYLVALWYFFFPHCVNVRSETIRDPARVRLWLSMSCENNKQ